MALRIERYLLMLYIDVICVTFYIGNICDETFDINVT